MPTMTANYYTIVEKLITQKRISANIMCMSCMHELKDEYIAKINTALDKGKKFLMVEGPHFAVYNKYLVYHTNIENIKQYLIENNYKDNILCI